jgi:hypothetical protein
MLAMPRSTNTPDAAPDTAEIQQTAGLLILRTAGLILLVAALANGSSRHELAFGFPRLEIAAAGVNGALGLWLLSGFSRPHAWVAACGYFGLLSGITFVMGLLGRPSCGCFGRVDVSPWWVFALDVLVVAALVVVRPPEVTRAHILGWLRGALRVGAGAAGFFALISGLSLAIGFDDPAATLARLRGESITVEPAVGDAGDNAAGEQRQLTIQVRNVVDRPVQIVGGARTCSCAPVGEFPLTVPPRQARSVDVRVKFVGQPGPFRTNLVLYTDDETQPTVVTQFAGRVIEPSSP